VADDPLVAASAPKHGVAAEDILHGYRNPMRAYDLDDGFTMPIGPATDGDLLEIGVVSGTDGSVIVHAMRARPQFLTRAVN